MQCPTNAQSLGSSVGSDTKPVKIVNGVAVAVTNDLLTSLPSGDSQKVTGRLYFPSYADIVGSTRDINRNDLHLDAFNPNNGNITRLVITMSDTGSATLILEKWQASLDANGNPYASNYISGQTILTF